MKHNKRKQQRRPRYARKHNNADTGTSTVRRLLALHFSVATHHAIAPAIQLLLRCQSLSLCNVRLPPKLRLQEIIGPLQALRFLTFACPPCDVCLSYNVIVKTTSGRSRHSDSLTLTRPRCDVWLPRHVQFEAIIWPLQEFRCCGVGTSIWRCLHVPTHPNSIHHDAPYKKSDLLTLARPRCDVWLPTH